MNSRWQRLAWQIDVIAHEQSDRLDAHRDGVRGHVVKWEGGGQQNRYERVRFPPWPKIARRLRASVGFVVGKPARRW